jgi:hypothetical protein
MVLFSWVKRSVMKSVIASSSYCPTAARAIRRAHDVECDTYHFWGLWETCSRNVRSFTKLLYLRVTEVWCILGRVPHAYGGDNVFPLRQHTLQNLKINLEWKLLWRLWCFDTCVSEAFHIRTFSSTKKKGTSLPKYGTLRPTSQQKRYLWTLFSSRQYIFSSFLLLIGL